MNDFIERFKNWKTTVVGIATALISILVLTGVLGPENEGVEIVTSVWDAVGQILAIVAGIILLFSKDK